MCGIAGIIGGGGADAVARMNDCLAHRGPDDEGVAELRDSAGELCGAIGQRRLSIIDLSSGGHQPMFAGDGRFAIVFNGEIYNYRELKRELEASGVRFRSASDTEVILEGLARHGAAFVGRLRGMFALVHWDKETRTATVARDRFGIKPLLWARKGNSIAFASELRALRNGGAATDVISPSALDSYLAWGAVAEPVTMLEGATALPAGAVATVSFRDGRATDPTIVARYLPLEPQGAPVENDPVRAAAIVRDALRDSVAHHLIADVPVAAFLSGGIDSSLVCALAADAGASRLDTFTVVFGEREFDEAPFARAAAKAIGSNHHEIALTADEFLSSLDDAFAAMDQPSLDGLNTFVVSRAVRRAGIKVVLSGLGGDEMFAGYPSFRRARSLARGWLGVRALRPLRSSLVGRGVRGAKLAAVLDANDPAAAAYVASRLLFPGDGALGGSADAAHNLAEPPAGLSLLQRVSWYELTGYMRNVLLRDSDIFSMAHGLELRVPFVDPVVAAASLAVGDGVKIARGRTKPLLVDAIGDRLPREILYRPKRGFTLPFDRWMRGALRGEIDDALTNHERLGRVGLDPTAVARTWHGFLNGKVTWSRPWTLYTLVRWSEVARVGAVSFPRAASLLVA